MFTPSSTGRKIIPKHSCTVCRISRITKELNDAEKRIIVFLCKQGKSLRQIAVDVKELGRTIHSIVQKYNITVDNKL